MARRPPHAPYRAGAPGFTPNMRPIPLVTWLAPDTEAHVLDWKHALLTEPDHVVRQKPSGRAASAEAAALVGQALGSPCEDLPGASRLVSDDLVVMEKCGNDWLCTGLTLTAPTFFCIDSAFGRDLTALHGPVPDGARLAERIGRVFDSLRPELVLERFNWTLQCGSERHTPDAAPLRARAAHLSAEAAEAILHLRVERQTIRRLPQTGAVLFTIRVCLDPLTQIPVEDRATLAVAWRGLSGEGRTYKRWGVIEPLVDSVFDQWDV